MPSANPFRSTLSVTQLEDRTNPVPLVVNNTAMNPLVANSLPSALAIAQNTPGQQTITFDFTVLGNTPKFTFPATIAITEGVVIEAGGGATYATFTGATPFDFTHNKAATGENPAPSRESIIRGGVFLECQPALVAGGVTDGGAVRVNGGQLTTFSTRFTKNSANNGGAMWVASGATLVLDGDIGPPDTAAAAPGNPDNRPDPDGYPVQINNGVSKTLFQWNKAGNHGGAIENDGTVILKRVVFNLNEATVNGGAINNRVGNTGRVTVPVAPGGQPQFPWSDIQIVHNKATDGGGVMFQSSATSTLINVMVNDNTATAAGGGLHVLNGTVNVFAGEIKRNNAPKGAAMFIGSPANETPSVSAWSVVFGQNFGGPLDIEVSTGGTLYTHWCVLNGDVIGMTTRPGAAVPGVHILDPLMPNTP